MKHQKALILLIGVMLTPSAAMAYVGPGAGLGAIGALLALIGKLLLAIVGFVWYPVKRMLKRRAGKVDSDENLEDPPTASDA
ncbi:MAG: hypothetical protein NXH78_01320 [Hyphomonadaceae bacterium]|nr:hypothetical protein [Hyphomonadaceae bacterium]